MNVLRGIARFLYDFIIGDDWKIAAGVVSALAIGLALLAVGISPAVAVILTATAIAVAFTAAILIDATRAGS